MARRRKGQSRRKTTTAKKKPTSKQSKTDLAEDPDTSPFRGFSAPLPVDEFDKLLEPSHRNSFPNRNLKTYTNRKKVVAAVQQPERHLLEFQDCKNRDNIVQWLNDTRNVFDKLTQTQHHQLNTEVEDEAPALTLDMPSVSQVNKDTSVRRRLPQRRVVRSRRSPYTLRARSLNVQVTKNCNRDRNKRHSLAGDTPSMEDYHIDDEEEEVVDLVPVAEAKMLVNMMEDECLSLLEMEVLGKNGWDRIKDVNRTINGTKGRRKQLNISHRRVERNRSYDLEQLENYFIDKMEQLMGQQNQDPTSPRPKELNLEPVLNLGHDFIANLRTLMVDLLDKSDVTQLRSVFSEIGRLGDLLCKHTTEVAVQTTTPSMATKSNQTQLKRRSVHVQVNNSNPCLNCANNNNSSVSKVKKVTKSTQTKALICPNLTRTDSSGTVSDVFPLSKVRAPLDTVKIDKSNLTCQFGTRTSTESSSSDLFPLSKIRAQLLLNLVDSKKSEEEIEIEPPNLTFKADSSDTASDLCPLTTVRAQLLNHTLDDVQFDTENMCQQVETVEKEESEVRRCSQGVKRELSPVQNENGSKRPCNKFLKENLTVNFESCAHQEEVVDLISDESDDMEYDVYLNSVLKRYDRSFVNKTQEDIEELEERIRNVTRNPPPPPPPPRAEEKQQLSDDSDMIMMEAEKNLTRMEKDLDYFQTLPKGEEVDMTTTTTPKKIRKKLFPSQEKMSESLFNDNLYEGGDEEEVTLTEHNVDMVMGDLDDVENDGEVQRIMSGRMAKKINILQNVVVRNAHTVTQEEEEEWEALSQMDVVEMTPQKSFSSFSQKRCESLLDITLPPPLEFQDVDMKEVEKENKKIPQVTSQQHCPLSALNKVTSTPLLHRDMSEMISLSPISIENNNRAVMGPIEMAQQSKFTPLTILKTQSQSPKPSFVGTPKQKSILSYIRTSQQQQQDSSITTTTSTQSRPCISCTRISRDQVMAISSMTNKKLATYSSSFGSKVTHMIVSVNNRNMIKDHTIKSVSAIAAGIWVLSYGWIEECLTKNKIVSEEPYEVLDVSGIPGPRKSRTTRSTTPLLKGYKIHVSPPFLTTALQDIENIIKLLGGRVVPSPEHLLDKGGYTCLIITEGKATQDCDSERFETWLEALRVVTVDLEWLSRSVGQYQLQSLVPFTLCSDEFIDTLGYPPELTSNVPVSFLQSTSSV